LLSFDLRDDLPVFTIDSKNEGLQTTM